MTTARQVVKRVLPSFLLLMLAKLKPRMLSRRAAERKVRRLSGGRVASGPFKGMKYLRKTSDDAHYAARLLGTYEMELAPLMESLTAKLFSRIIVVGAAEGYYAVGLALRHPRAQVFAFEATDRGQRLLRRMIELNGVEVRVVIDGRCDDAKFRSVVGSGGGCLVFMDVEGYEEVLLDPKKIRGLSKAEIVVELHDFIVPDVYYRIAQRFDPTHRSVVILEGCRTPADFPYPSLITGTPRSVTRYVSLMHEARPTKMRWLHLEPLSLCKSASLLCCRDGGTELGHRSAGHS
jgi:hypothetical protein